MMAIKGPRGPYLVLLSLSVLCSLVSIAALILRPESTASWRTSLNIIAIVSVVSCATLFGRRSRGHDA